MDKENVTYVLNGVLFSHEKQQNYVMYRKMEGTGNLHVKQDKPDSER
jgi:hypothetical protein